MANSFPDLPTDGSTVGLSRCHQLQFMYDFHGKRWTMGEGPGDFWRDENPHLSKNQQLQCGHFCLRISVAVGHGILCWDEELVSEGRCHQLQYHHQFLWKSLWMACGLGIFQSHDPQFGGSQSHQLQQRHEFPGKIWGLAFGPAAFWWTAGCRDPSRCDLLQFGDQFMWERHAMATGPSLLLWPHDQLQSQRGQLQCFDQCLRKGLSVGTGPLSFPRDDRCRGDSKCGDLQCDHQFLWKRLAMGSSIGPFSWDESNGDRSKLHQLQCRHQFLWKRTPTPAICVWSTNDWPSSTIEWKHIFFPSWLSCQHDYLSTINISLPSTAPKSGRQWQMALELFQHMDRNQITPNVVTFNALISAAEKSSAWPKALQIFAEHDFAPDGISWNGFISACCRGLQWQLALKLFHQGEEMNLMEAISYSSAISSCELSNEPCLALGGRSVQTCGVSKPKRLGLQLRCAKLC